MISYRIAKTLSLENAAYIGGLIDGEGTVTLQRLHKNENRRLAITISSTERQLLEFVLKECGVGKITTKKTYSAKHSRSFTYAVYNRQALNVLSQVYPYLRSYKKERADLVLKKYLELTPRNGKYSDELLRLRNSFETSFFSIKPNSVEETRGAYHLVH